MTRTADLPAKTAAKMVAAHAVGLSYWADHPAAGHIWAVSDDQRAHVVRVNAKEGTAQHVCNRYAHNVNQVSPCEGDDRVMSVANVDAIAKHHGMRRFDVVASVTRQHVVTVETVADNHGYPYRAKCACGWESNTYASQHAAQAMGDDHLGVDTTPVAVTASEVGTITEYSDGSLTITTEEPALVVGERCPGYGQVVEGEGRRARCPHCGSSVKRYATGKLGSHRVPARVA
ncbi:hypothetical protein SEA_TYPHA_45 [Mycobacterium phage Typha]|uniref:Uncharacterized protein n=1 Tax=Mycobacterium phage Typha TaxID=2517971 RepID=A0A482J6L2_9CAUD|nr:hypothetical protein KCH40_gp124 [Mycobacterium phage Typha]QBP29700.1 hypothetical protein SEA_TYPHA_45 [Mycobacterium phage Typha]